MVPNGNNPVGIYLLKSNNRNTRIKCGICSELTIKTAERRPCRCYGVFIVNYENISHYVLVFLLLTLNINWWLERLDAFLSGQPFCKKRFIIIPMDTGRKFNVLCTFNLRPVSTRIIIIIDGVSWFIYISPLNSLLLKYFLPPHKFSLYWNTGHSSLVCFISTIAWMVKLDITKTKIFDIA